MSRPTAEEFAVAFAARSGLTLNEFRTFDEVVVRCHCDYEKCEGWAMVSREFQEQIAAGEPKILGGTDYRRVYWPSAALPCGPQQTGATE